jgi:large subunit ribosomal protein L6
MSRIGKLPIAIPGGVTVDRQGRSLTVKGPKGSLGLELRPEVEVEQEGATLKVTALRPDHRESRAYHGMTRAILDNMMVGVTKGYERSLEIVGVGWNAGVQGKNLTMSIGFCNPVVMPIPEGLSVETPKPTVIVVKGSNKQLVGQFAAAIRSKRPPEPYKGKGVRYEGEHVRKKQGKTFGN